MHYYVRNVELFSVYVSNELRKILSEAADILKKKKKKKRYIGTFGDLQYSQNLGLGNVLSSYH